MKAIRIYHPGGVPELRYQDVPAPELCSADDVIVRLKAAAVNGSDIQARQNRCRARILGSDGAGVVTAMGSNVTGLKIGAAVCLYPQTGCGRYWGCHGDRQELCEEPQRLGDQVDGTYAQSVRVERQNCFAPPRGFSYEEAAALPVAYLSAWRMLITDAELKPGESVLIRGIGDSIAIAALQLALSVGAHTIVTADNGEKLAQALRLGAQHGIDESEHGFATEARRLTGKRGVDIVVDCVGGDSGAKSFAALTRDGRLVTCGASAGAQPVTDLRRIFWHHLKVFGSTLGSRDEFRQVIKFLESTGIKPIIDSVYPLAEAASAHQRFIAGRHFGKIVLRMTD